jgi:radical SAM protein with 4Fe4S-binding SPASM domain
MDHGFPPYIMATISQETCESLPALLKWLHARRLAARLSVVRQPNGSWERRKGLADEYGEMCHRLADAFDNAFIDIEGPDYHFDLRRQLNICELSFKEPTPGVTCGIGSNHIIIRPDGTLVACPMTVSEQGKSSEGDLLETCKECFRYSASERYAPPDKDECLKCKWFPVCAGGCPITNLRMNGHPFSRSPLCQFYMKVIPRFVEFFGKKVIQASTKLGEPHSRSH